MTKKQMRASRKRMANRMKRYQPARIAGMQAPVMPNLASFSLSMALASLFGRRKTG